LLQLPKDQDFVSPLRLLIMDAQQLAGAAKYGVPCCSTLVSLIWVLAEALLVAMATLCELSSLLERD
jgi:hypothetical protein